MELVISKEKREINGDHFKLVLGYEHLNCTTYESFYFHLEGEQRLKDSINFVNGCVALGTENYDHLNEETNYEFEDLIVRDVSNCDATASVYIEDLTWNTTDGGVHSVKIV